MPNPEHIAALKAAADPERVATALGLRGRGGRYFCPRCQPEGGKTPDLSIHADGFHCFKCGWKGDMLKLVMGTGNLDFPKAIAWLENLTGIRPPERRKSGGYRDKGRAIKTPYNRSWSEISKARSVERSKTALLPDPAIYEAFLNACRPVEGRALKWLTDKIPAMTAELVERLRLRFCGREYLEAIEGLRAEFDDTALEGAGLLKRSKDGRLVPTFGHYHAKRAGFLVIPYLRDGRPIYLKARPLVSKAKAERLGLARFMNTAGQIPCLYNADALKAEPIPAKVFICEGESDTWAALADGKAAVGCPGANNFKAEWVEAFRPFQSGGRSRVYLVPDADDNGAKGARSIAGMFLTAGLPVPMQIKIPSGKDLCEYLKGAMTA